tara:strand:- start:191907 stop:193421 length:1515 start_codon:yes stop_codon:yes gene_type:complete
MGARTGKEFLAGLKARSRDIWIDGESVKDVTTHPKTSGAANTMARVFDRQHERADICLVDDVETGEKINVSHHIPRSHDEVRARHAGLTEISEVSMGIMGRTPDYMNMKFSAFAAAPWVWAGEDNRNEEGSNNLVGFQKKAAREDLSMTHTIVNPTNDKSGSDNQFADMGNKVAVRKVGETSEGIIVRGARVLATLAPFADVQTVYPGPPLPPGTDPSYAVSFWVPLNTPGMKFFCRDSLSAPESDSWNKPLSARFDEQDAFCVFDDVLVPWENVFIDSDVEIYNAMQQTDFWINMTTQATTRALTKLEFAYGLANRMAEMTGDNSHGTIDLLGEIACYVQATRNALELSVEHAYQRERCGSWFPAGAPLHPMRALLPGWMVRVADIVTMIGGHNLLTTPSKNQFDDPALRPLIEETLWGANDTAADERAEVFRMAWDFVGSGLAGRGFLYERFYLMSAPRNRALQHRVFTDRTRANRCVDEMLELARLSPNAPASTPLIHRVS